MPISVQKFTIFLEEKRASAVNQPNFFEFEIVCSKNLDLGYKPFQIHKIGLEKLALFVFSKA